MNLMFSNYLNLLSKVNRRTMSNVFTVKVITLNCWGIVFVSKDRRERMYAIAKHLSRCAVDFVCLQEVWSDRDYEFLRKKAEGCLPYSHYFNSGVNGPGLCVLSRHPIVDVYFHQCPINGYAHKIHQGDWFGGKGVGLCRIQMGERTINLYTAHLHAEYDSESLQYLSHRVLQAFDVSQFIKLTSNSCDLTILAGDLNSEPHDPATSIIENNAQLVDCYLAAQKKSAGCIGTNESFRNSYAPLKELKRQPEGKRIDYIMIKNSEKLQVDVLEYLFPLPDRVPGCMFSYSDHEAVEVVLECSPRNTDEIGAGDTDVTTLEFDRKLETVLSKAIEICNDSLKKLALDKGQYYAGAAIFGILLIVSLFVELFFYIPSDAFTLHTTSIIFFNILKIIFTTLFLFSLLMATLWNRIEYSAIIGNKNAMVVLLRTLSESRPSSTPTRA